MALTQNSFKWKLKNSLYLLWGFFPVLNSLAFFHMFSRVKKKKWSVLGWVAILTNVALIILFILSHSVDNPNVLPNYKDVVPAPRVVDFMNPDQKKHYNVDWNYKETDEFKSSDEYLLFQQAEDEWEVAQEEWERQPEISEKIAVHEQFDDSMNGIGIASGASMLVINIILFIVLVADRYGFLESLAQSENRVDIKNRLFSTRDNSPQTSNVAEKSSAASDDRKQLDINSATEEDFAGLRGLTIIDAKKAISFREEHKGFKNIDEFFDCVKAKPHIIVSLESSLTVGEYHAVKTDKDDKSDVYTKRTLDL